MKHPASFAAMVALCLASPALADIKHSNLSYGPGERNVMDLYLPEGVENPPIVLYIHGGAWFRGDKDQVLDYNRLSEMNAAGIAVATMNYTWSQQAIWPAQKTDVESALRFVAEQAETYGYDADQLVVWGQSSGAHLALWAGVLDAQDPSLKVDAVVSWYAPSNLYQLWDDREADAVPGGNEKARLPSPESKLLGVDAVQNKDVSDAASPDVAAASLSSDQAFPPTFLVHGDSDPRVSPLQSARVEKVLADLGTEVSLTMVKGGKHGGEGFDAVVAPSLAFIKSHFDKTN
jgi:acetyl esterase/lipase